MLIFQVYKKKLLTLHLNKTIIKFQKSFTMKCNKTIKFWWLQWPLFRNQWMRVRIKLSNWLLKKNNFKSKCLVYRVNLRRRKASWSKSKKVMSFGEKKWMRQNYKFGTLTANCKLFKCWLRRRMNWLSKSKDNYCRNNCWFKTCREDFNNFKVTLHNLRTGV